MMPNIQKHHSIQFNHSFICRSTVIDTNLPTEIKQKQNIHRFTTHVKKILQRTIRHSIDKEDYICILTGTS